MANSHLRSLHFSFSLSGAANPHRAASALIDQLVPDLGNQRVGQDPQSPMLPATFGTKWSRRL